MIKFIVDSNNISHIALYGCGMNDDNCNDEEIQGLFYHLFMTKIMSYFENYDPNDIWFVFDNPRGSATRKQMYPAYKQHRKKNNSKEFMNIFYKVLLPNIKKLIKLFPCNIIESENGEGDDIIYGLCNTFKEEEEVYVISGDGDLLQLLLHFKNVKIYNPRLKKYMDKPSDDFIKLKSIIGDTSDNLKGVIGVGEKNAIKYLTGEKRFNDKQKEEYELTMKLVDLSIYPKNDLIAEEIKNYKGNLKFYADDIEMFLIENSMKQTYARWPVLKEKILKWRV